MSRSPTDLLSCNQLVELRARADVILLDCTMKYAIGGGAVLNEVIPGAIQFQIDTLFDDELNPLPHMLPATGVFSNVVSKLGIDDATTVILYDARGVHSSPRAWWMFRAMGHKKVFVLDGGLRQWVCEGLPTRQKHASPSSQQAWVFQATLQDGLLVSQQDLLSALQSGAVTVVDARSAQRFRGAAPEPREGVRLGHIPGAKNIPFASVLRDDRYKPRAEIRRLYQDAGVIESDFVVYMCGSGVTACILALAGAECGYTNYAIYDGSWADWGSTTNLPVHTEAAGE